MGWVKKMGEISSKWIYFVLAILLVLPLIVPIPLPLKPSHYTLEVYEAIESLKPGDNVLFVIDTGTSGWPALGPGVISLVEHLFRKDGVKVFFVEFESTSPPLVDRAVAAAPSASKKQYGVDWIHLGFVAGEETGKASFAADIRKVISVDYKYGKPIDEYPIMKDVKNMHDFKLIVEPTNAITWMEQAIRQWVTVYKVPLISIPPFLDVPWAENFYRAGQLKAYLAGTSGLAEYEQLLGIYGDAIKSLAVMTTTHTYAIILFIIGNIAFFLQRKREVK
ncbi:MAG: hypothetical protein QXF82_04850 [Nitrososphaeria archaeon]